MHMNESDKTEAAIAAKQPIEDRKPAGLRERIVGGNPAKTALKLVVASIFVGGILAVLNVSPIDFWNGIFSTVKGVISRIGDTAGEVVVNLATYLVLGAAIVVPIWIVMRLLGERRR
jgi:hypothetical protein